MEQQQTCQGDPCFIMIRYPMSLVQTCKNSLTKQLSIHSNYEGRVSGVSPSVQVLEGGWAKDRGIALMYFESVEVAERWYYSVPEIKQQDWLGGVDMILVPVCQRPDPDSIRFIQLLDLEFYDFQRFQQDYSGDASAVIQKHCGKQIVSTPKSRKLRGLWEPNYLILNCWGSAECFEAAYHGEENQDLKYRRQQCSQTSMGVFALEPLIPSRC